MAYSVIITDAAEADLLAIHTYIEKQAGTATAQRFVDRIEQYCLGFADVPKQRARRDDLRRGGGWGSSISAVT